MSKSHLQHELIWTKIQNFYFGRFAVIPNRPFVLQDMSNAEMKIIK